jgi:hypothetical protein
MKEELPMGRRDRPFSTVAAMTPYGALSVAMLLGACSDGDGGPTPGPPPASITVDASTNNLLAEAGTPVVLPPSVTVFDTDGNPLQDIAVTFAVASGGGSATGVDQVTNSAGTATVGSWTMGPALGPNTMTATVAGLAPVSFSATAVAATFTITLDFISSISSSQRAAFNSAASRWSQVITGDLLSITAGPGDIPAGFCGIGHPAFVGTIDDVIIWVEVAPIDGPGGVLGQAGPCAIRNGSPTLPILGVMQFDVADLATIEGNGTLGDVILHEMGHVLGLGTLWSLNGFFDLLRNPSCPGGAGGTCVPDSTGADTHFTGSGAVASFNGLPGGPWNPPTTASSLVPVENTQGGPGTRDGDWRESTFVTELMTGFITGGTNPLSVVTVSQFADLGYTVDLQAADSYTLGNPNALRMSGQESVRMIDDVWRGPIYTMGTRGRLARIR